MKRRIFTVLSLILFYSASAQELTKSQVREGLNFLKNQMQTYHPGLLAYNPDFDEKSNSLIQSVDGQKPLPEYFELITRMVAMGNEGHYSIGGWQDTVHKGFGNGNYRYMPLVVKIVGEKLYVWDQYLKEEKPKQGDEIISINGIDAVNLMESLYPFISSDGHIKTNMRYKLSSSFNYMYYLYISQPDDFEMELISREDGKKYVQMIPALTLNEMRENYKIKHADEAKPNEVTDSPTEVYEFEIDGKSGFLTLKTFSRSKVEKYDIKAKKLYQEIFRELADKQIENLVIDLRGNNGGLFDFSREILPYIQKENEKGIYRTSVSWKGKVKTHKLPKKSKWAFDGKIYLLVDGGTFSAASSIARYVNEYHDPIIVGEEAGGRYEGYVAGSKQYVILPNSAIRIGIPRYQTKFPESHKQTTTNRGILPDHEVAPDIDDLIESRDVAIEFAQQLIRDN